MQVTDERNLETIPVRSLRDHSPGKLQELGDRVNNYLVAWRNEREHEHKEQHRF